jgi:ABC-type protease/lipase transport system fused ATPase/permease subunit
MSRVFEALKRVSEPEQRQAQRPVEKIESAEASVEGETATSKQHVRTNGTVSVNATVGETYVNTVWDELRPLVCYLAAFSFFINLLFLVPAIFTQQVFDRVLSSRSQETLLVLLGGAGVALLVLLWLDTSATACRT